MSKDSWLDSFKLAWYTFARSRGWKASITLSNGMHMEGASGTIKTNNTYSVYYKHPNKPTNHPEKG